TRLRRPVDRKHRHTRRSARRHADECAHVHAFARQRAQRLVGNLVDPRRAARGSDARDHAARRQTYSIPSCTRWSSSIATSPPPFAANVGPVHFFGCARCSLKVATAFRASSIIVIFTSRASAVPSRTVLIHWNRSSEPTSPRLSVTSSFL